MQADQFWWVQPLMFAVAIIGIPLTIYNTCYKDRVIARIRFHDSSTRAEDIISKVDWKLTISPDTAMFLNFKMQLEYLKAYHVQNNTDRISSMTRAYRSERILEQLEKLQQDVQFKLFQALDSVSENESVSSSAHIIMSNGFVKNTDIGVLNDSKSSSVAKPAPKRTQAGPSSACTIRTITEHPVKQTFYHASVEKHSGREDHRMQMRKVMYNDLIRCVCLDIEDNESLIDMVESMRLLPYNKWFLREKKKFSVHLTSSSSRIRTIAFKFDSSLWEVEHPSENKKRFSIRSLRCNSFVVLTDDFFLAYDEIDNTYKPQLWIQVPGAHHVSVGYQELVDNKWFFDSLIGTLLPIQLVHFLVRRFVQLTGANWEFDCLASTERKRREAASLRWYPRKLFGDITIELGSTLFNFISGVDDIGRFENENATLCNVAIRVFGDVIGFRIGKGDVEEQLRIAYPVFLPRTQLLPCPDFFIDKHDFAIGGDSHAHMNVSAEDLELNLTVSSTSQNVTQHSEPTGFYSNLKFTEVFPSMLALGSVTDMDHTVHPVFNLAYEPKNRVFQSCLKRRYYLRDLDRLRRDLMSLDYGKQLSDSIQYTVINHIPWSSDKSITLGEAQLMLFQQCRKFRSRNLVALSLMKRKYISRGTKFLVLYNEKLCVAQARYTINQEFMFTNVTAQSVDLGPPISKLRDAVAIISGTQLHSSLWTGIEQALGAVNLVGCLLERRVKTIGRFGNFCLGEAGTTNLQTIEFDMPISCGVAFSTLLREDLNKPAYILIDDKWDPDRTYDCPVVLGMKHSDRNLVAQCQDYSELQRKYRRRCSGGPMSKSEEATLSPNVAARKAFDTADRDKTGCINFQEFREALRGLTIYMLDHDAQEAFAKLDVDRDGRICEKEFVNGYLQGTFAARAISSPLESRTRRVNFFSTLEMY